MAESSCAMRKGSAELNLYENAERGRKLISIFSNLFEAKILFLKKKNHQLNCVLCSK